MDSYYSITQMTREFGVSTRTLRYYEDEGLLRPERKGRTRLYTPSDRRQIDKILRARRIGFKISEISEFLKLDMSVPDNARELRLTMENLDQKREELRRQRRDLETMIDDLDNIEDACLARMAELGVGT